MQAKRLDRAGLRSVLLCPAEHRPIYRGDWIAVAEEKPPRTQRKSSSGFPRDSGRTRLPNSKFPRESGFRFAGGAATAPYGTSYPVTVMEENLLSAREASKRLGVSTTTFYDWLARSDGGHLTVRGMRFTIDYFQGGAKGQGRIMIEVSEIERLKDAMRVRPQPQPKRRLRSPTRQYPGITVPLGRPD